MATSGSSSFTLAIDEVIDEAFEAVGGEPVLGKEAATARRSLNLLLIDWQNRGINLWTLEAVVTAVATSVGSYTLTSSTANILDAYIRRDDLDLPLERISVYDYAGIPNKTQTGRPSKLFLDRQRGAPVAYLWPLPENSTDELYFWRVRDFEDITRSADQHADVPKRFLPALTAGLAYYISRKRKGVSPDRIARLKAEYEELLMRAMEADDDGADMTIVPGGRRF